MLRPLGPIFTPDPVVRSHPLCPAAWWLGGSPLDGGRRWYDLMGRYPATMTGFTAAGSGWRPAIRPGGHVAPKFDGVSDWFTFGAPAEFRNLSRDFTVAAWIRNTTSNDAAIYSSDVGGFCFRINTAKRLQALNSNVALLGTGTAQLLPVDSWYHVAVTASAGSTATFSFYIDGRFDSSFSSAAILSGPGPCRIGSDGADSTPWGGSLDDVLIAGRAFSAAEIRALYDESRTGYPTLLRRRRSRAVVLPGGGYRTWYAGSGRGAALGSGVL